MTHQETENVAASNPGFYNASKASDSLRVPTSAPCVYHKGIAISRASGEPISTSTGHDGNRYPECWATGKSGGRIRREPVDRRIRFPGNDRARLTRWRGNELPRA